jgi:hypothetical protein
VLGNRLFSQRVEFPGLEIGFDLPIPFLVGEFREQLRTIFGRKLSYCSFDFFDVHDIRLAPRHSKITKMVPRRH